MIFSKEFLTAAALGTSQHDLDAMPSVQALLAQVDSSNREKRLLTASAALTLAEKASWTLPRDHRPLAEPPPPDNKPICSTRAIYHLTLICEGHYRETLPEWLTEVAKAGKRAPEEALPLLLDLGHKEKDLRDLILPLLGERGRWLAEQIRDRQWRWFSTENDEKIWQNSALDARLTLLENLRKTNPARARELVLSTWADENQKHREAFAKAFNFGLSLDDEPFLESLLDDKAASVRQIVIEMLSLLPDSRFCQRMIQRAVPLLTLVRQSEIRIAVHSPEITPDMARDGITKEGGWVLQQVLSYVSPRFWCDHWELTPDALIKTGINSAAPHLFIEAWSRMSYRWQDAEFAEMLLAQIAPKNYARIKQLLVPTLAAEQAKAIILAQAVILSNGGYNTDNRDFEIISLKHIQQLWSHELTRVFLAILRESLEHGKTFTGLIKDTLGVRTPVDPQRPLYSLLRQFALYIPPDMSDDVLQVLQSKTEADTWWEKMLDDIRLTFEFRRDMLAAIHGED